MKAPRTPFWMIALSVFLFTLGMVMSMTPVYGGPVGARL